MLLSDPHVRTRSREFRTNTEQHFIFRVCSDTPITLLSHACQSELIRQESDQSTGYERWVNCTSRVRFVPGVSSDTPKVLASHEMHWQTNQPPSWPWVNQVYQVKNGSLYPAWAAKNPTHWSLIRYSGQSCRPKRVSCRELAPHSYFLHSVPHDRATCTAPVRCSRQVVSIHEGGCCSFKL